EWVIVRRHENASLKVDHRVSHIVLAAFVHAPSRQVGRIVCRAQQAAGGAVLVAVSALKVVDDFALVPDVIAGGDDIDTQVEQILRQGSGDAEAAGGVFTIGNDQIDGAVLHQSGQAVF